VFRGRRNKMVETIQKKLNTEEYCVLETELNSGNHNWITRLGHPTYSTSNKSIYHVGDSSMEIDYTAYFNGSIRKRVDAELFLYAETRDKAQRDLGRVLALIPERTGEKK
jgi:hypothetical protein